MLQNIGIQEALHPCPVCGHREAISALCSVDGYDIFSCAQCGADHVYPCPDEGMLKVYYDRQEWFEGGERGGYRNYDTQTEWSIGLVNSVFEAFGSVSGLSVLDVGCGYGVHLASAAIRGWKCFGVELSDHAREVAQERLGSSAYIVEEILDLIPHEFDLILILDMIEHLPSPYSLLYRLFTIGAITAKTQLVITTPNAGSAGALSDPAGWAYRHPPSHLVFYTAKSLQTLLNRLRFRDISVTGLHGPEGEENLDQFAGLLVKATGSDFKEFMHERYVPDTWSKITKYEHIPRYILARNLAENKQVLDFGCGTGYGSAILAEKASDVLGLDIDSSALDWARELHRNPCLDFYQSHDLGKDLRPESFDVVTCFEMIEHVDHQTQQSVIAAIGRLLREDGLLIISTPNPEITKLYGENPYHLHELTETGFLALLTIEFPYVRILRQFVRNSIRFVPEDDLASVEIASFRSNERQHNDAPLAYIALCSRQPLAEASNLVLFDEDLDSVREFIGFEKKLNQARFLAYSNLNRAFQIEQESLEINRRVVRMEKMVAKKDQAIGSQSQEIQRLFSAIGAKDSALVHQGGEIQRLNQVVVEKDNVIGLQSSEIHRLFPVIEAKDGALVEQGDEIQRLNQVVVEKDNAIGLQSSEIHRLFSVLNTQDCALEAQRIETRCLYEVLIEKDKAIEKLILDNQEKNDELLGAHDRMDKLSSKLKKNEIGLQSLGKALTQVEAKLRAIQQTKIFRLRELVLHQPWNYKKALHISYLFGALITPRFLRNTAMPWVMRIRRRATDSSPARVTESEGGLAYVLKQDIALGSDAPKIAHVIANFMTGGSSRIVVDLIENLGNIYRQSVITSFIPNPPAYTGLDIEECRFPVDETPFIEYFLRTQADFVHVHYWGDCDEPWYAKAIEAAKQLELPIIENVNTPVTPYLSDAVLRYVYVSDYVREVFGRKDPLHITIHPGADFSHFNRSPDEAVPGNCVGMVYRLEPDKLSEQSILPFIRIAQRRPRTRMLIVGGGSLLQPFQAAASAAGVADCFEFTGYVSYGELPDFYRRMSIFVAPVWKESFGQVSSFAMNMRIPVIGYDTGAIGEIVTEPELLAPPDDAEKLADIAINLLDSPQRIQAIGNTHQARVQSRFSVQSMINAYARIYSEISRVKEGITS